MLSCVISLFFLNSEKKCNIYSILAQYYVQNIILALNSKSKKYWNKFGKLLSRNILLRL